MDESQEEIWVVCKEFPRYSVSNFGRISNNDTGRILKPSMTLRGIAKIGLVREGKQWTRSVSVIVADAFVEGKTDIFNTPLNMDGDRSNNRADNLVWRPRWFVWRYFNQFDERVWWESDDTNPVVDIKTGIVYKSIMDAALSNCLLARDVSVSIHNGEPCFPTWQRFDWLENPMNRH